MMMMAYQFFKEELVAKINDIERQVSCKTEAICTKELCEILMDFSAKPFSVSA